MKKLSVFFSFLFLLNGFAYSDVKLSDSAEISVITCGPGEELYTAFGHSAIRIKDRKQGLDKIYNYGTFDFNKPNFYTNFAKGYLYYYLSTSDTGRFLRAYKYENRWVKEQVLNLNNNQNQKVFEYLEENTRIENREYVYDYFFNNCSTKIYDVLNEALENKIVSSEILFENKNLTHRDLVKEYLKNNKWGEFGINLCLGSAIDRKITEKEYLFLPDYVYTYFNHLSLSNTPLVKKEKQLIYAENNTTSRQGLISPFSVFSIFALLILGVTYFDYKNKRRTKILDFSLLFIFGLLGTLLLLIWTATNHISAHNNLNVLWAFPPNLIVGFYYLKDTPPKWIKKYTILQILLICITLIIWLFKVQVFSTGIIPILFALIIRYTYLKKTTD